MAKRLVILFIFNTIFWLYLIFSKDTLSPFVIMISFFGGIILRAAQYYVVAGYGLGDNGGLITGSIMVILCGLFLLTRSEACLMILFGYFASALFSEHIVHYITKQDLLKVIQR